MSTENKNKSKKDLRKITQEVFKIRHQLEQITNDLDKTKNERIIYRINRKLTEAENWINILRKKI